MHLSKSVMKGDNCGRHIGLVDSVTVVTSSVWRHKIRTQWLPFSAGLQTIRSRSLCENYFHTTGQSDWYFLIFYLSWLIFTCHIIEYTAKFDKSYLSLRQTRFRMDWSRFYRALEILKKSGIIHVNTFMYICSRFIFKKCYMWCCQC